MKPTSGREFIEGGGGGRNGVKVFWEVFLNNN